MSAPSAPLAGWRVVITRDAERASSTADLLAELGATALLLPTIAVVPPPSWEPLDDAIARLDTYDWLLLTSGNAVRFTAGRLSAAGVEIATMGSVLVGCVGKATARALEDLGRRADLVPERHDAATMAEALVGLGVAGKRMLFPQAMEGRTVLQDELRRAGAAVDVVPAYQTVCPDNQDPEVLEAVRRGEFDAILFASPSALTGFRSLFGERTAELLRAATVVSIGHVTGAALAKVGVEADVVPLKASATAMVSALADHVRSR